MHSAALVLFFFFQAEDGIRDYKVTGVQTCALPIFTDLAERAGMTKQSMGDLVAQCEAWGLVTRESDERDARARRIRFTPAGLAWLQAFHDAVSQAEAEFREEVGDDIATVVALGLEAYAGGGSLG